MVPSGDGVELAKKARAHANNIIYILPKNVNLSQIKELVKLTKLDCLLEKLYLNGKLKMLVAYFGPRFICN